MAWPWTSSAAWCRGGGRHRRAPRRVRARLVVRCRRGSHPLQGRDPRDPNGWPAARHLGRGPSCVGPGGLAGPGAWLGRCPAAPEVGRLDAMTVPLRSRFSPPRGGCSHPCHGAPIEPIGLVLAMQNGQSRLPTGLKPDLRSSPDRWLGRPGLSSARCQKPDPTTRPTCHPQVEAARPGPGAEWRAESRAEWRAESLEQRVLAPSAGAATSSVTTMKLDRRQQDCVAARKRHHLSHAHVQMAAELGMDPRTLGKLDNHRQERWKVPLPAFIEHLYEKRFGHERPADVFSVEERARQRAAHKAAKKEAKKARREAQAGGEAPDDQASQKDRTN